MTLLLLFACAPDAPKAPSTDPGPVDSADPADSGAPDDSGEGPGDSGSAPTCAPDEIADGAGCYLDCSADLTTIGSGLAALPAEGAYLSVVVPWGDRACPLIVDPDDVPVAAMAKPGAGRVLALGHETLTTNTSGDNGAFLRNALMWAGGSEAPRVGIERGSGAESVRAGLNGWGWTADVVGVSELEGYDVLLTESYMERSEADNATIAAWLEAGGGLVTGGHAWNWAYGGGDVASDYPGNQLLNRVGINVTAGYATQSSWALSPELGDRLYHPSRALNAVADHLAGTSTLGRSEQRRAATSVMTAATWLPLVFDGWWDPARALLDSMDPVIPSASATINVDNAPLDALVVTLWTRIAGELPPDEVPDVGAVFPGDVTSSVRETVTSLIRADYQGRDSNYAYSNAGEPVWRGTGAYAAPGEVLTVTVPAAWASAGLSVRIGAYTDELWSLGEWERHPAISRVYDVESTTTSVASGFGGPVYVRVPAGVSLGEAEVTVEGGLRYPRFVRGETDADHFWDLVDTSGAPTVEIEGEKFILTLPTAQLKAGTDVEALAAFYDTVLDVDADLAAISRDRVRPERFAVDEQISAGWMHSGYPLMGYDYGETLSDSALMSTTGDWGIFHEIGHNHQWYPAVLPGCTEATVNLWSVYVMETVVGVDRQDAHSALSEASRQATIDAYLGGGRNFADWEVWTALETLLQLQERFGWEFIIGVHARYLDLGTQPSGDQDIVDTWVLESSLEAGMDLTDFYDAWGFPISEDTRAAVSGLPVWLDHPLQGR